MEDYQFEITWLGHAAFKIKTFSGRIIYFDPYQLKKDVEKADIVVSTHSHPDHFSREDIKKIATEETVVLGPESIASSLQEFDGQSLKIGDSLAYKDLSIELIPAYNIKKANHPKKNEWAGIILRSGDKSIYHAGDTERIPEMKDLANQNITVAMIPCGGTYTMDFNEAADSATDVKPEIVIPMHNWGKDLNEFKEIMEEKDPNIKVEILEESGKPLKI